MLANTSAEIRCREHIQAAATEIQVVLINIKLLCRTLIRGLLIKKGRGKPLGQVRQGRGS